MIIIDERQKENFEEHVATLTDLGNIKILDFAKPGSSHYRIRFLFEEDYCKLHITGDLGELIAANYNNMTYEGFTDYVHNIGYFKEKIKCCSRELYEYDEDDAREYLKKHLEDCDYHVGFTDYESLDEAIDDILQDFDCYNEVKGIGPNGYEILEKIDDTCWDYAHLVGRKDSGILQLYMLAFELATSQLKESQMYREMLSLGDCNSYEEASYIQALAYEEYEEECAFEQYKELCMIENE